MNLKKIFERKILIQIVYYVVLICLLTFISCAFLYKGFPNDLLKKNIIKSVNIFQDIKIHGYEINDDNEVLIATNDPNIIIYPQNDLRTIKIDIEKINMQDEDNKIKLYYADSNNEDFSEEKSIEKTMKKGVNTFVIPYGHTCDKVRIDIGNFKGESFKINSIVYVNKFDDVFTILGILMAFSLIYVSFYIIRFIFVKKKSMIENIDVKINEIVFAPIETVFKDFYRFCIDNRRLVVGVIFLAVITYGAYAFNYTLSIDEENNLANTSEFLTYFSSGRFSLAILIKIFSLSPYVNSIAAVFLMLASAIIWCMLFSKIKKISQFSMFIFSGLYMAMPYVIGETLNFAMQGVFIALGYCCIASSMYIFMDKDIVHKKSKWIWSVLLSVFSFGIYQSFVCVFVFVVAFMVLIMLDTIGNDIKVKDIWRFLYRFIVVFIVSVVIYEIINYLCGKFISAPSGYLESVFIGWNKHMPNAWVFKNVWQNWYKVITGNYFNMTGGIIVKISVIVFICYAIIKVFMAKKWNKVLLGILCALLPVLPFAIPLCLGSFVMLGRSLNAFPILIAGIWLLVLNNVCRSKVMYKIVGGFVFVLLIMQIKAYNEFVFIDQLRYKLDIELASSIMEQVNILEGDLERPIVFTGTYDFKNDNNLYLVSGCESFFAFQQGDNFRILNFLNLSGYKVLYPNQEQINEANTIDDNMTCWPQEGSVFDAGDYIVVKLGESE